MKDGNPNPDISRIAMWREDVLRIEIRTLRATMIRVNQWGVTVLASLQTALYFVRKDTLDHLHAEDAHVTSLPPGHYLIGTVYLLIVATIFSIMGLRPSMRLRGYRNQLKNVVVSGIEEMDLHPRWARLVNMSLFYVFPLFDICLRAFPTFGIQFRF